MAKSDRKNDLYPKSYGAWAGNPKGHAPDYERCVATVKGAGWHYCQCSKKRGYGPDEAYCKQHDPAVIEARVQKKLERYHQRWNQERYKIHGPTFYAALKKIADGHNDPRTLAKEIIEEFHKGEST